MPSVRTAVVELEKAGYIQRAQTTDKAGKFSGNEYIIREYPTQVPLLEKPSPVFPTQINQEKQITDSLSKESFPFPSSPPAPDVGLKEAKGRKHGRKNAVSKKEMDGYRELIRKNICYDNFARERPYDVPQLDEMVEAVRVAGNDFPQAVVKSGC